MMTSPHVNEKCYGYGLWLENLDDQYIPHFEGLEPGISSISTYDHEKDLLITLVSNKGNNVWKLNRKILIDFYNDVSAKFYYGA